MTRLFLIPVINIFEVHDSVVKDWLNKLDETSVHHYLENPFKLERYFSDSGKHALISAISELKKNPSDPAKIKEGLLFLDNFPGIDIRKEVRESLQKALDNKGTG